MAECSFWDKL